MNHFKTIWRWLGSLGRTTSVKQEIDEELRFHLEQRTADYLADGMTPEEAAREARKRFGNIQSIREECRDVCGASFGEATLQDLRFAFRQMLKNPGFVTVAVLTLALGIGVNTSMFTGLRTLLLPELPYPNSERLVRVFRTSPHSQRWPQSPGHFLDYQAQNTVFDRMAAVNVRPCNLAEAGHPAERAHEMQASADLIPLLGIQPLIGRGFTPEEDRPGENNVIILNHGFWLRRFAADPNIVGRTLRLDGVTVTVIGVMPVTFQRGQEWGPVDVVRPIAFTDSQRQNRGGNYLNAFARLKEGVSLVQARAGMNTLVARMRQNDPDNYTDVGVRLQPMAESRMDPRGRTMLWLMMGLAGFVLLIACANLANLQFARTALRAHELAIRGALGAPRGRLLRQLLTESLLIAIIGGLVGLALSSWINQALNRQLLLDDEPMLSLKLNFSVLSFTFAISTLTGLAFGLVPAWLASRTDVNSVLKQGSRGTTGDHSQHRLRHGLIVLQVALALILLAGAGLVVNGLQRFRTSDPGWRVDGLTVGYLNLTDNKYSSSKKRSAFAGLLQEKIAVLPGVERATVASALPISGFRVATNIPVENQPESGRQSQRSVNFVSPGYFATLGMRLVEGRDFDPADTAERPGVVVVNETLARAFWPGESAVGKRIGSPGSWQEIIGVVSDVRFPSDPSEPSTRFQSYRPLTQEPQGNLVMAIRGNVSAATLRQVVAELDPDLPVSQIGTVNAAVRKTLDQASVAGWLLGGFAGLGLFLSALGIYGVIAGFVVQRTKEIGVRMALGARISDVLRLVLAKGLQLTLLGAAIGLAGAIALMRILNSLVPGLEANSLLLLALVTSLLMGVAMVACWIPARRAAKVDPMVALQTE